jgi:nitroreductase
MQKELLEMSEGRPSLTVDHGEDNGRSVTTELLKPAPASTTLIPSKSGVEPLRSVIITPKGTKRRGKGI